MCKSNSVLYGSQITRPNSLVCDCQLEEALEAFQFRTAVAEWIRDPVVATRVRWTRVRVPALIIIRQAAGTSDLGGSVALLLQQELDDSCVLYAQTNAVVYDKPLAQSLALPPLLKRNSLLFSRQNFSQLSHLVTGECALSCSGNNRTSLCAIMGKCNASQ